jgi:hypothetical protein
MHETYDVWETYQHLIDFMGQSATPVKNWGGGESA